MRTRDSQAHKTMENKISRIIVTVIAIFMATIVCADQKAITDTVEEVIVNGDSTWVFANKCENTEKAIKKMEYKKPGSSTFLST